MARHIGWFALSSAVWLGVIGIGTSAEGQSRSGVQAGIRVRPDTVTVGQHFDVVVRIRAPQGATIAFPDRPGTPANIDSAGSARRQDTVVNDAIESTIIYRLAAWRTGMQQLGLGAAVVSTATGDVRVALSDSVFVKSVLPADTTLHKPKPARPLFAVSAFPWWLWALIVAVALLLAVVWWIWRRSRRVTQGPLSAFAWAEQEFQRIERRGLLERRQSEEYAITMIGVVRGYLERTFATISDSATTRELAEPLRRTTEIPFEWTIRLFERVDLLKFADDHLGVDDARALGAEGRDIVREIDARLIAARREAMAIAAETGGAATNSETTSATDSWPSSRKTPPPSRPGNQELR